MYDSLEDYILDHIDAEPIELYNLNRETHLFHLRPRMCSGHLQGRLLKMFVRMIKPKQVLELGTFTGYSALCMAEGFVDEDCTLDTIEIDDELEEFIRTQFSQSAFADRVTLHIGDANEIVRGLKKSFDLVFIDANKRDYIEYYNMVFDLVPKGGFIIADNTLWDGKVVNAGEHPDAQTAGIMDFNRLVADDSRVETVILPIRDGLTILYKK